MKTGYLNELSKKTRIRILEMAYAAGKSGAHVGSGLSSVEILCTLYGAVMKYDMKNPADKERDRFILSKGHSAIALYAVLEQVGFLEKRDIELFEVNGSPYYAHATRNISKGIEFSGGSLSLGLSFASGVALALKKDGINSRIFVLVGDGECDEGLIWETLSSSVHYNLSNLTLVVDYNGLQSDGFSKDVMNKTNLAQKISAFGFNVLSVNGHDVDELYNALTSVSSTAPSAVIAHTVKGKGVSFMENNVIWHHNSLNADQFNLALSEQNR